MKKSITVLSTISLILFSISILLAVLMLTVFWKYGGMFYTKSNECLQGGPILPIGSIISAFKCFVITLVLLLTSKSKRFIAVEIIAIVLLIGFPILSQVLQIVQQSWINAMGSTAIIRHFVTEKLLYFPNFIMGLSSTLNLLLCGMRISLKLHF